MHEIKNSLLKRREVTTSITHSGNPGYAFVTKHLAEHFKVPEEHIAIKSLHGKFGSPEFIVQAFIYDSAEDKKHVEPKPKIKKKTEGSAN